MRISIFTTPFLVAAGILLAAAVAPAPAGAVVAMNYQKVFTQTVNFSQSFNTTQQYTGNTGVTFAAGPAPIISFSRFNPVGSQGQALTLTSISILLTRSIDATITLDNGSGNARTGNLTFTMDSNFSSNPLFGFTNQLGSTVIPFNIAGGTQGPISTGTLGGTAINNFSPSNFAAYIGTGDILLTHSLSNFISAATFTGGGSGSLRGTSSGTVSGEFQIIYTYLDPLPEPGTWAMLLTGFFGVGAAARRQRRASAA
jgi:hypothetical protein